NNLFQTIAELAVPKLVDFGELLFGEKLRWTVKEMWTNMLETGGNQTLHAHANSFISGIFYLTPSHPGSRTVFVRPPGGSDFSFRHHTRSAAVGPFNAGKYVLPEAEPGDLVLFPSYLYHEVPRNQGDQRITIAFNAIPDHLDCWGYRVSFDS
ncbi:2OG-Fe(II) oxygenase family protein, partial [Bradyrhizobium sp.]